VLPGSLVTLDQLETVDQTAVSDHPAFKACTMNIYVADFVRSVKFI